MSILDSLPDILSKIGVIPRDLSLYETACVHRSFLNESPREIRTHFERLEFLGDAALELAMTHLIFEKYPDKEEGWMTDLRSSFVRGSHLAEVALEYELDTVLLISLGERNAGGNKNPNILADMLEAILGAIYLDQGFDAVFQVIKNIIFTSDKVRPETKDPKSKLQEIIQQHLSITPTYTVLDETGKDHEKIFTIIASVGEINIGQGTGTNKKIAQESAAQDALTRRDEWSSILTKKVI